MKSNRILAAVLSALVACGAACAAPLALADEVTEATTQTVTDTAAETTDTADDSQQEENQPDSSQLDDTTEQEPEPEPEPEPEVVEVANVSLNRTSWTAIAGKTMTLKATVCPTDADDKSITWSSSNTSVATVSASGKVTAKAAGTATINATASNGKTASCKVTVRLTAPIVTKITTKPTSIKLNWKKVKNATGYIVYRSTSKNGTYKKIATVSGTTYTNKNLTAGKTYYYKIVATGKKAAYKSNYSAAVKAKARLNAPTVTAKRASYNSVKVSWTKVSGATGYRIYRATSKNGTYVRIATVSGNTTSFRNKNLTTGKTYYYKVVATGKKAVYKSGYSVAASAKATLAKVGSLTAKAKGTDKITLSWKAVSGATKYEVYRATSKTGTYKKVATVKTNTYQNSNRTANTTYYYKVRAVRSGAYGAFSAVKSAKTKAETVAQTVSQTTVKEEETYGKTYTITYVMNGGEVNPNNPTSYIHSLYEYDSFDLQDPPERAGYKFVGWYDAPDTTEWAHKVEYFAADERTGDITLYAAWKETTTTGTTFATNGLIADFAKREGYISLMWDVVSGASSYRIYRSDSNNQTDTLIQTISATAAEDDVLLYEDEDVSAGNTYTYYVVATLNNTETKRSNSATCTISYEEPVLEDDTVYVTVYTAYSNISIKAGQKLYFSALSNVKSISYDQTDAIFTVAGGHSIYGVQDGVVPLTVQLADGKSFSFTVTVTGEDNTYSNYYQWKKQWIADHITDNMTTMEKVKAIQTMLKDDFTYQTGYSSAYSLYKNGCGDCLSGAAMLKAFCDDLGIPCTVRSAANDLANYNINYGQFAGHFNCFVWIDGEKYLADGTPGHKDVLFLWTYD